MSEQHSKYDLKESLELPHHDPSEGFDNTEPASQQIWAFTIATVVMLVAVILALQFYFNQVWDTAIQERVLSVPGGELKDVRNLEQWRFTHYEFTDNTKSAVRIPLDQAKALILQDAAAGKTFYPAKPTEPKPEVVNTPAPPAEGAVSGKQ